MAKKIKDPNRVPFGEKMCYLLTNIGNIPIMVLLSSFFLIFYTNVVGLDAGKLATLFLVSKIMDGISDPVMGYLLDRFPVTKMGKFRPMLILGVIICSINYIFLWFGAAWASSAKYLIVYITYLLLGWTFDIMDISLNSILPVMTDDQKQRNSLSLIKMIGYVFGGAVVGVAAPLIVADGSIQSYYILIFGAVGVVLVFSICGVLGIKERVKFEAGVSEHYSFKELLGFFKLRPVLAFFISNLILTVGSQMTSSNTYYFTYVMGDLALMSGVTGMAIVGMVPGIILSPIVANKLGKRKTFIGGLFIAAIGFIVRIFNPTSLALAYVGTIVYNVGNGMSLPLVYGIQADNCNYVEYHTGKHAEAAVASLNSFITKVGQGVAGAIPGYILAWTGFSAAAATQPQSVINGLICSTLVIPALFLVASAVIFMLTYKLDKAELEKISSAIQEKHENMTQA